MARKKQLSSIYPGLLAIFIAGLILAACSSKSNISEESPLIDSQNENQMTIIEEDYFQVTLPGEWEKISGPDPYVYFNSNDKEALTVSMFGRSADINDIDRSDEFRRLADLRQQAERESSDSLVTSNISYAEQDGTYVASFTASDQDFLSATLMLGVERFIAQFFYEGHGVIEAEFSRNTRTIMNSIILY